MSTTRLSEHLANLSSPSANHSNLQLKSEDENFAKPTRNTISSGAGTPSESPATNPLNVFDHCEVHAITPRKFMQNPILLPSDTVNSFLGRERKPSGRGTSHVLMRIFAEIC
jgi:hypothetical protein